MGLSDPVEILKICHQPRKFDPLVNWIPCSTFIEELYLCVTPRQADSLVTYAAESIGEGDKEKLGEMLICIAAFTGASLDKVGRALISKKIFYPGIVFCRCSEIVRDELILLVESDNENRNLLLLALAWIGDEKVIRLFAEWRNESPSWGDLLFIAPEEYAKQAGWELASDSTRRDLFLHKALGLEASASEETERFAAIRNRSGICSWCSGALINLFEFDPILLEIGKDDGSQKTLTIPTCQVCTAFGQYSGVYSKDGEWSLCSEKPEYLPDDSDSWDRLPENPLKLGASRTLMHSAGSCLPTTLSQIGGLPAWEQDAEYPDCPKCQKTMKFVGQISDTDIEEYSEGIFYGFICRPCRATSTSYQQT